MYSSPLGGKRGGEGKLWRLRRARLSRRNNIPESLHSPFETPHPKDRGMKKRGVVGRINSKHGGRERERVFSRFQRWVTGLGYRVRATPLRSFFSTLLLFLTNLIHISTLLDRVNHGGKIDQLVATQDPRIFWKYRFGCKSREERYTGRELLDFHLQGVA